MKKLYIVLSCLSFWIIVSCNKEMSSSDASFDPGSGSGQAGSLARFATVGNSLYLVDQNTLKIYDISDRNKPVFQSTSALNTTVETIFPRDKNTLFIGSTNGMFIYDISTPQNPKLLSQYQHITSCDPVVANDDYAFVTLHTDNETNACWSGRNELHTIDIRNLSSPDLLSTTDMVQPFGLGLYGDTLLVCDRGIKVYEIAHISSASPVPVLLNTIEDIDAVDIIPYGDLMIVVSPTGLNQYRYKSGNLTKLSSL